MVKRTQCVKGKIPNFLAFSLPAWFHPYVPFISKQFFPPYFHDLIFSVSYMFIFIFKNILIVFLYLVFNIAGQDLILNMYTSNTNVNQLWIYKVYIFLRFNWFKSMLIFLIIFFKQSSILKCMCHMSHVMCHMSLGRFSEKATNLCSVLSFV